MLSYPQIAAKLFGKHFFELTLAQCIFVPVISRVLMEGLDHELHGILQGGSILRVRQRHSVEEQKGGLKIQ